MKIGGRQIDGFLRNPPASLRIALFYGPDEGKVREFSAQLAKKVVGSTDDPFNTVEITPQRLKEDPSAILDEASSLSLMGGKRLIRVLQATDAIAAKVEDCFGSTWDSLVILEGTSGITGRSKLVKSLESSDSGASIACYPDEARDLPQFVAQELKLHQVQADQATMEAICARLGPDRALNRRELEKLALGADEQGNLSLETVLLLLGDSAESDLEALCFAVLEGRLDKVLWAFHRLEAENIAAPRILSAVTRHVDRMHRAQASIASGASTKDALGGVGFRAMMWKLEPTLTSQIRRWPAPKLAWALKRLYDTDAACRSTGSPDAVLTKATLFELSKAARALPSS